MLNRRHIRVKVMQSIYAMGQTSQFDLTKEGKFLKESMDQTYHLYLLMLDLMVEVHAFAKVETEKYAKKILATAAEKNPNRRFLDNEVLQKLANNSDLQELISKKKLHNWRKNDEYVAIIYNALLKSEVYQTYMEAEETSFKADRRFVVDFYTEILAPNDKLYDYLEDQRLTWLDDLPLINMAVLKRLEKIKPGSPNALFLPSLFKNDEDQPFGIDLLEKTIANDDFFTDEIQENTPNWDKERIADVDFVLIKMALCEFLKFPTIPVKATINEYLEIAKEYSTPKSSIFINGILDRLVKRYQTENKLNKQGRGLQE